jgi:hypothetical protein
MTLPSYCFLFSFSSTGDVPKKSFVHQI